MSAILKAIQTWSTEQPAWQQEAMVRLFEHGDLTQSDDDDLYALLKAQHGIPDAAGRLCRQLTESMVAPAASSERIQMTAIGHIKHVNALASDKILPLSADGLTAVYGGNGAGKSGYARLLKKACRARGGAEPILQNVNIRSAPGAHASAQFTVVVGGIARELTWTDGTAAPTELGAFAVFDARCARHYMDEQGETTYSPYGMDILRGLADACGRLRARRDDEAARAVVNKANFHHLSLSTNHVGALLRNLSATTSPAAIQALANLSAEEGLEHAALFKALNEPDPKQKAHVLKLQGKRFAELADRCGTAASPVADAAVEALHQQIVEAKAAKATAAAASQNFRTTNHAISGIGSEMWRRLLLSAREFVAEAYPGKTLSSLGQDDACPLCQKKLEKAALRLAAFDAFIEEEAEKAAFEKRELAKAAFLALKGVPLSVGIDAALSEELKSTNAVLWQHVRDFEEALSARRKSMLFACGEAGDWSSVPALPESPGTALRVLSKQAEDAAAAMEQLIDEASAARARARFKELADRTELARIQQSVLDVVAVLKKRALLDECEADLRTHNITAKVSVLNKDILTANLEKALNTELKALGVDGLSVVLTAVNVRGNTLYRLVLQRPGQTKPTAVLSEGEQRAVAIAAFLADLSVSNSDVGIIFDDPVSSLDHERRERVARRLAVEAKRRQVIVLTHDLVFLFLLEKEAALAGSTIVIRSLKRTVEGCGIAEDSPPFSALSTKNRVKKLRQTKVDISALLKQNDTDRADLLLRSAWVDLRLSWERAVEEVLLNNVVRRFDAGVSTQGLTSVEVSDEDALAVFTGMTRCNKTPHDGASAANVPVPTVDELHDQIEALHVWLEKVRTRNNDVKERRGLN